MGNAVLEIADRVRGRGVPVVAAPGCEARGNGSSWGSIDGFVNHHTAGGNNFTIDQNLINGVPGLSGPLCNYCIMYDGDLGIIAAFPANHAGASGGWDTAPLPVTNDFNRRVLGVEIQYKGIEPMSPAQYNTMCILNHEATVHLGWPLDYVRSKTHNGTSIQGKWDPGYANGKTYDIAALRRDYAIIGGNAVIAPPDPDAFPLRPPQRWGPVEGDEYDISNSWGTPDQRSIDGLKRWQSLVGIPASGIYDTATKNVALALQQAKGWALTMPDGDVNGRVWEGEWNAVVKEGWRPAGSLILPGDYWERLYNALAGV